MGGSGQPLETFGKGFKGKPGNLRWGRFHAALVAAGGQTTRREKTLGTVPEQGGWWDGALPQGFGGFKALGAGLGGRVLPRSHRAATGEEGPTSLGSPSGHPQGPAAALTVLGVSLGSNFHFNIHFLFQFHITVSI